MWELLCSAILFWPSRVPSILGVARCFTFGGSRKIKLHDPAIMPRSELSKEQYVNKDEQTTINHFHEKLLKLKDMMKTEVQLYFPSLLSQAIFFYHPNMLLLKLIWNSLSKSLSLSYKFQAGKRRAEKRHKFMEEFLKEFYEEWNGVA